MRNPSIFPRIGFLVVKDRPLDSIIAKVPSSLNISLGSRVGEGEVVVLGFLFLEKNLGPKGERIWVDSPS